MKVIAIMMAGMLAGWLLRNRKRLLAWNARLINVAIYFLLFFLGVTIGTDETIVSTLPTLGVKALWLALGGIGGSVLLAWGVYILWFRKPNESE